MVFFNPLLFVEIVGWYNTGGWFFVDLFFFILIFGGLTKFALSKASAEKDNSPQQVLNKYWNPAVIGLTLAFSFSLLGLEAATGLNILALGPFAALMLGLLLMIFVRNLVKEVYDAHHLPWIAGIITGGLIVDVLWSSILAIAPSNPFLATLHFTLQIGTVIFNILLVIGLAILIKEGFAAVGSIPEDTETPETSSSPLSQTSITPASQPFARPVGTGTSPPITAQILNQIKSIPAKTVITSEVQPSIEEDFKDNLRSIINSLFILLDKESRTNTDEKMITEFKNRIYELIDGARKNLGTAETSMILAKLPEYSLLQEKMKTPSQSRAPGYLNSGSFQC